MFRRESIASKVELRFPRDRLVLKGGGISGLMTVNMFIGRPNAEFRQGIADLHVNVEIGTQEDARHRFGLLNKTSGPGKASLVVQEEKDTA